MKRKRKIVPLPTLEAKVIKVSIIIVVIVAIIMIVVLGTVDYNIAKIEREYEISEQLVLEERIPVEEQMRQYIDALELPEEAELEETETEEAIEPYYTPTEEERKWAYFMAKAEAGTEDSLGMTFETNVAINRAIETGDSLIEVYTADGQYSSIHNGLPHLRIVHEDGSIEWILVTEDMITDEIREAVDKAFEKDYTEERLKEEAISKGFDSSYYEGGALYFYNPNAISAKRAEERAGIRVSFQHGNHRFHREW